jgi:hypothetical protein
MADDGFTVIDVESFCLGLHEADARLESMFAALEDMHVPIREIEEDMYAHTAEWMDSSGEGSYTPLEESTIRNKIRMGYPDAGKPLFASGALFESASTPAGPYSTDVEVMRMEGTLGVDWEKDGYNIALLHHIGVPERLVTQHRHHKDGKPYTVTFPWHLPSRPIFTVTEALAQAGANHIVDHVFQP